MMTAMIEIQTIAQVTSMPIDDRPLTPTDAAMMAPLIDGALQRFEDNLTGHPLLPQLQGYRFGAMVEDARTAGLLLEATRYRGFRVTLELAGGKRQGEMQIILPERAPAEEEVESVDPGPGRHADRLMLVPAQIEAVLCRLRLPLSRVGALKAGDLLTLPADALCRAELMAGGGHRMARGRLGQINGMRAICLTLPDGARAQAVSETAERAEVGGSVAMLTALPDGAAPVATQDADAEHLPDLPPLVFDAGEDDFGGFEIDFDADASGAEDFPMMAMTDFNAG
jgi:flagellar motor switch protein FliM